MKRQFEKVLNDFQPGLLRYLSELNKNDSDNETEDDPKSRYAAQEILRRERHDQKSNKRRRVLKIVDYSKEDNFECNMIFMIIFKMVLMEKISE